MTAEQEHPSIPDFETIQVDGFDRPVRVVEGSDGSAGYLITRPDGTVEEHSRTSDVDEDAFLGPLADNPSEEGTWTKDASVAAKLLDHLGTAATTQMPAVTDKVPNGEATTIVSEKITKIKSRGGTEETEARVRAIDEQVARTAALPPVEPSRGGLLSILRALRDPKDLRDMRKNRVRVNMGEIRANTGDSRVKPLTPHSRPANKR